MVATILLCAITSHAQENNSMSSPMGSASPAIGHVEIPRIPQITLAATPAYGTAPMFVGFLVSSSNPEAIFNTYRWNFGDGQVSTLPPTMLFHTFKKPGTYVVSLTVTTADGHQATGFTGVIVKSPTGR